MDRDTGARLTQIETKLAWLEDFLTRIQTEVVDRSAALNRLTAEHGAMKSRLIQLSRDLEEVPNRRPPHY
jgi:SlyX protein